MKVEISYSLGCGGYDGYRTVTLPKYMEKEIEDDDKMREWLERWLRSHVPEFRFNLEDWIVIE